MKSILISIQPQWIEKILNREKTIEIRKTKPKIELPCKVYIYCTHSMKNLCCYSLNSCNYKLMSKKEYDKDFAFSVNGSVVAEFTLNKIGCLPTIEIEANGVFYQYFETSDELLKKSCLTREQILGYANGKDLYALHIEDLKIYDKPLSLIDFGIKRPPQSYMFVESLEKE